MKPDCQPEFFKFRNVPFALRCTVEQEIDKLVLQGILEPVTHSEWATPTLNVMKKDGSVRICGDYRCTVIRSINEETYPIPTAKEIFSDLSQGKKFTTLDLS